MNEIVTNWQWLCENSSWWASKEEDYSIDNDWNVMIENPSIYPAFKWRKIHSFRSLMFYFQIVIREHTDPISKRFGYRGNYSVLISGSRSSIPLPKEQWGSNGDPWCNPSVYSEPYYFSIKYKDKFEYNYYPKMENGIPSGLVRGFDTLEDANVFVEKWKLQLIEDHKEHINKEKELMKVLFIKDDDADYIGSIWGDE